jgi:hypothetical protein
MSWQPGMNLLSERRPIEPYLCYGKLLAVNSGRLWAQQAVRLSSSQQQQFGTAVLHGSSHDGARSQWLPDANKKLKNGVTTHGRMQEMAGRVQRSANSGSLPHCRLLVALLKTTCSFRSFH